MNPVWLPFPSASSQIFGGEKTAPAHTQPFDHHLVSIGLFPFDLGFEKSC